MQAREATSPPGEGWGLGGEKWAGEGGSRLYDVSPCDALSIQNFPIRCLKGFGQEGPDPSFDGGTGRIGRDDALTTVLVLEEIWCLKSLVVEINRQWDSWEGLVAVGKWRCRILSEEDSARGVWETSSLRTSCRNVSWNSPMPDPRSWEPPLPAGPRGVAFLGCSCLPFCWRQFIRRALNICLWTLYFWTIQELATEFLQFDYFVCFIW